MPRKSNARLNLNQQTEQQPQPPPTQINPSISSTKLEEIIAQRIATALANITVGGIRNEGNIGTAGICTYKKFMNCKKKSFNGTEGVVNLTRWIEKAKSVYQISLCPDECKVQFAACTFADAALTWWNSHVNTMGINTAISMK